MDEQERAGTVLVEKENPRKGNGRGDECHGKENHIYTEREGELSSQTRLLSSILSDRKFFEIDLFQRVR